MSTQLAGTAVALTSDDYRAILGALETIERARTISHFRRLVLEALECHLGYRLSTFIVGGPPTAQLRVHDGITHGLKSIDMEEYIELWTSSDPSVTSTATARMASRGLVDLFDLAAAIGPDQRDYLERFLLRQGSTQLSLWLDTGLPSHGYISLLQRHSNSFGPRDRAILLALRPHLGNILRSILLEGGSNPCSGRISPREEEVATLVAKGCGNREIASQLGIGEDTVKKHLWHAMSKLKVRNRTQLALLFGSSHPEGRFHFRAIDSRGVES